MVFVNLTSSGYGDSVGIADEALQAAGRVNGVENEDSILEITVGCGRICVFWKEKLPLLFCFEIYILQNMILSFRF